MSPSAPPEGDLEASRIVSRCSFSLFGTHSLVVFRSMPGRWAALQAKAGFGGSRLLGAQMDKFVEFGISEDLRRRVYVNDPDTLVLSGCVEELSPAVINPLFDDNSDDGASDSKLPGGGFKVTVEGTSAGGAGTTAAHSGTASGEKTALSSAETARFVAALRESVALASRKHVFVLPKNLSEEDLSLATADNKQNGAADGYLRRPTSRKKSLRRRTSFVDAVEVSSSSKRFFLRSGFAAELAQVESCGGHLASLGDGAGVAHSNLHEESASKTKEGFFYIGDESAGADSSEARRAPRGATAVGDERESLPGRPHAESEAELSEAPSMVDLEAAARLMSMDSIPTSVSTTSLHGYAAASGPTKVAGIVRDEVAAGLLGLPTHSPHAGMPYVNGILSKLIRLSELPEFMREAENVDNILLAPSPGDVSYVLIRRR